MPPVYRVGYQTVQRDSRTPLWYKRLYNWLGVVTIALCLVTASGAIYEASRCQQGRTSYLNGNRIVGWLALVCGALLLVFALFMAIRWQWLWLADRATPVPVRRYGDDIEDVEPGFLVASSTKSFLSTQSAATATKREVEHALSDLNTYVQG